MIAATADERDGAVDVVVVGFGGAGSAAALAVRALGGSVVVLEKQDVHAHSPSTMMLAGAVLCVDDVDRATEYFDRCASGAVPRAVSRAWATKAAGLYEWIDAMQPGYRLVRLEGHAAEHDELPGAEQVWTAVGEQLDEEGTWRPTRGTGLFGALASTVAAAGVDVWWRSAARRLLRTPDGRVVGVEYGDGTGTRRVWAKRGVVLACGGFEFNEEMKQTYLPAGQTHFYGNPGNTGDGIAMAQAVGAGLWHMTQIMGRGVGHFARPDGSALNVLLLLAPRRSERRCGYVITDRYGARYANEQLQADLGHGFYFHMLAFDPERREHPRIPSYWFFDDERRAAGPLTDTTSGAVALGWHEWSADNRAEIDAGWVASGSTYEEVAAAAGIADPDRAAETIRRYNAACETDAADPFGRPAASMVALTRPPFYCVKLWPGGTNTCGGPRRNERGEVLDAFGAPIAGLYCAGELGQAMGPLYPGSGAYYSEILSSGLIAGEEAMRSEPPGDAAN